MKKILLLSMPFAALERQALGLSLFKARLTNEGYECDIRYLSFTFADLIGVEEYSWLSADIPHTAFAGEWVFSPGLYGFDKHLQDNYVREVLQGLWQLENRSVERILRAQRMAPLFIEHCLQTLPWDEYAIVGFTSTFEQNISSLVLAKRIKAVYPGVRIVFGGANWEGEMGIELHRCFPFVDYAFSGEADEGFPELVRLILSGHLTDKDCADIPGLIQRINGESVLNSHSEPVQELDRLPIPDYSDYFRGFNHSSANSLIVPTLLFEGSRGCWWGSKHHCMFCGLNGATMKFRAKSPQRALNEIEFLVRRWQTEIVQAVDNVVPMQYFRYFFPSLSRNERLGRMFYEIRANLKREHIKALRDARVLHVQPGIESFSDHILKLMHKGTTGLKNIQVLKWCKEYGVQADYNLLYGFPGETKEDYQHMFGLLRAIRFLDPPTACGPIRLDRFSPYYREAKTNGFQNLRPVPPYHYLYPFGELSVGKIAYYFDYDLSPDLHYPDCHIELIRWVEDWKTNPETGTLQSFQRPDGTLAILDTRSYSIRSSVILSGIDKAVYEYCDCVQSLASICRFLAGNFPGMSLNEQAVHSFLNALVDHGYMLGDDSGFLSLALRSYSVESARGNVNNELLPEKVTNA